MNRAVAAILVIGFFVSVGPGTLAAEAGGPTGRCVLGWIPYWDQKRAVRSFSDNVTLFGTVSLFWYFLGADGKIKKYAKAREDKALIDFAHDNGVKVLGLIANLPDDSPDELSGLVSRLLGADDQGSNDETWDTRTVRRVLRSPELRAAHIRDLVALAKRMNFDGINIDYESLAREDREDFSTFIRELSNALHAQDLILAVALHPKTREFSPAEDNGSHAQDWDALAPVTDELHLITYGQHWARSAPGPIASPDWMGRILRYAVETRRVPADKLFIGIPLYAESWSKVEGDCAAAACYKGDNFDLTYEDVRQVMFETGAEPGWDEASASPYLAYEDKTGKQMMWFEDHRSVAKKLLLREKYGICHIGLWRLGGEDPKIWPEIWKAMQAAQEDGTLTR